MATLNLAIRKRNGTTISPIRTNTYRFVDWRDGQLKTWRWFTRGETLDIYADSDPTFIDAAAYIRNVIVPVPDNDPDIIPPILAITGGPIYLNDALVLEPYTTNIRLGGYLASVPLQLNATRYWYSGGNIDHIKQTNGVGYALGVIGADYSGGLRINGLTDTLTSLDPTAHGANFNPNPGVSEVGNELHMSHNSRLFSGPRTVTGTYNHWWNSYARGVVTQWGLGNNVIDRGDGTLGPGVAVDFAVPGILSNNFQLEFDFDPDGGIQP